MYKNGWLGQNVNKETQKAEHKTGTWKSLDVKEI